MKKIITAFLIIICAATVAFADDWQSTVAALGDRIKTQQDGAKVLNSYANLKATSKEEYPLYKQLWTTQGAQRATIAMTLVNSFFPNGDPGKWEQVNGMFGDGFNRPRQLAAIDALFVAVDELSKNSATLWGAALLLQQFGESAYGKVMFIEQTPEEVKAIVDRVVQQTQLQGDWTVKKIRGKFPILPIYDGRRSHSTAENLHYIYLDNYGCITNFGEYGWDRDKGYIYEIFEDSGGRGFGRM